MDCGDYVVVSNASKVKVSGLKEKQLVYRKHTMFPGGLKETSYEQMMATKPWEVRPCRYPRIDTLCWSFTERLLLNEHMPILDHSTRGGRNVAQKQTA